MRTYRAVTAAMLAAGLAGVGPLAAAASAAAPTGVGTAKTSTSVLQIQLGGGKLLDLRLGGEDSQSTTDKAKAGAASAFTRLVPLSLASAAVPALSVALPAIEARAPGGASSVPAVTVPLGTPASTGSLSLASLSATVDATGARSALSSALQNLSLAGGLVAVPSATSTLGTDALTSAADGLRGVKVDKLTVVDLGALLDGLGLKLSDLPISVITNLLGQLGITIPGLDPGVTLTSAVDTINAAITQVNALLATNSGGTIDTTLTNTLGSIVGSVGGVVDTGTTLLQGTGGRRLAALSLPPIPAVGSPVSTLSSTIDSLQKTLIDLLGSALATLDAAPLLSVTGLDVGITTKAADNVANSAAGVTAKIGNVLVGGKALGGADLGAAASQLANTVSSVTSTLTSALGAIDPGLANLVSVKLFDQAKEVKGAGAYTTASARLTALTASVTPPADLAAVVTKVQSLVGIGDVLGSLGVSLQALPVLDSAMPALEGVLGNVQALSQGATIRVADLSSSSEFSPSPAAVAAPAPGTSSTELPRTGGDNAAFAVLGMLLLAMAVGLVRWLRRPVTAL